MGARRGLIVVAGTCGLVAAVVTGFWLWGRPRASVAMPDSQATPVAVVRAYVQALDERDYATSNALQPYGGDDHWWSLNAPTITHLHITTAGEIESGARLDVGDSYRWKQGVEVDTTATFHNFSGMSDGSQPWSYELVRDSSEQPWRVLDWGQG